MTWMVRTVLTNETGGYVFSEWTEPVPESMLNQVGQPLRGSIYRAEQAEFGRCTSKIYVDPVTGGPPREVGWYFVSRQRYEDTNEPYLRGAWVTLHQADSTELSEEVAS